MLALAEMTENENHNDHEKEAQELLPLPGDNFMSTRRTTVDASEMNEILGAESNDTDMNDLSTGSALDDSGTSTYSNYSIRVVNTNRRMSQADAGHSFDGGRQSLEMSGLGASLLGKSKSKSKSKIKGSIPLYWWCLALYRVVH